MKILVLGLVLWTSVHLVPSLGQPLKKKWIAAAGELGYKGSFALLVLLSVVFMVYGWRHTVPTQLYTPPFGLRPFGIGLVLLAFLLMGAAQYPTRIKSIVRHPQLTGFIVWSTAHLLLNGDSRSVVLFGWLGIWAVVEIVFINRRDGLWIKGQPPGWSREAVGLAISFSVFAVVMWLHPYFTGMPVIH